MSQTKPLFMLRLFLLMKMSSILPTTIHEDYSCNAYMHTYLARTIVQCDEFWCVKGAFQRYVYVIFACTFSFPIFCEPFHTVVQELFVANEISWSLTMCNILGDRTWHNFVSMLLSSDIWQDFNEAGKNSKPLMLQDLFCIWLECLQTIPLFLYLQIFSVT